MVRGALVALLDLEVIAEVANGDDILPAARRCQPDVAVVDIDLPGMDGRSAATEFRNALPGCKTLILTSLGKPGTVRRALSARVVGFLLKDAPAERLANAIREVAAGRRVVGGDLAMSAWESSDCPLTEREIEVLRLAANGRHRRPPVFVRWHRPQLPDHDRHQAECAEPGRRHPPRDGRRVAVVTAQTGIVTRSRNR